MIKYLLVTLILLSSFRTNLFSKVISVPKDYKKIQLALDASIDGDTILVSKGVYKENIDLSALQKGVYLIEIKSTTATIAERIIIE